LISGKAAASLPVNLSLLKCKLQTALRRKEGIGCNNNLFPLFFDAGYRLLMPVNGTYFMDCFFLLNIYIKQFRDTTYSRV